MVRLLAGDDERFGVDPVEIERKGVSYTVDTLAEYANRFPDATRYLLVGADILGTFAQWREPRRIRELAEVVILERAVSGGAPPTLGDADSSGVLQGAPRLMSRRVDVSS